MTCSGHPRRTGPARSKPFSAASGRSGTRERRTGSKLLGSSTTLRPPLEAAHTLVIDRLSWWYDLPREWLKKIALLDDVYLLNNPFTFQAMESTPPTAR